MGNDPGLFGRKVFFLYPPSVLEGMLPTLVENEFEVYLARDHGRLKRYLRGNGDAILFINIDDGLSPQEWDAYVRSLLDDPATKEVRIGIVTYNENRDLAQKYLMQYSLPCGFITLKTGLEQSKQIILKTLEANEARGRRKFVRAICSPGTAGLNVRVNGELRKADITDISSAGLACGFASPLDLKVGTRLTDIQVQVRGIRVLVSGVVITLRDSRTAKGDTQKIYVVLFTPDSMDDIKREKIHSAIYKILQVEMDKILQEIHLENS